MPLLAGLMSGLFASLASFFATWVTKKTAFGLAAIAVFGGLTVAFGAAIAGGIAAVMSLPGLPNAVVLGMQMFMPDNIAIYAGAVIAADTASALYRWNVENLRLMAYVT